VPSAPITSPTSSASKRSGARSSRRYAFTDPELNELITDPLSLADYDTFILRSEKECR